MGARRVAAVASSVEEDSTSSSIGEPAAEWGHGAGGGIGAAVTALQDCLVWTRRATLAAVGAALRVSFRMYRCLPITISSVNVCAIQAKHNGDNRQSKGRSAQISAAVPTSPFDPSVFASEFSEYIPICARHFSQYVLLSTSNYDYDEGT